MKRITILLVEDDRVVRGGIKAMLNAQADLRVVGVAAGNDDALLRAQTSNPQLVLVDLGLRGEDDLHLVERLTKELPQTKVIGMGLIPSQSDIVELVQAGAAGFILKDATRTEILATVRAVAGGMKILPPLLMGSLFTHVVTHALQRGNGKLPDAVRMTTREREITALIAEGMSNKGIAHQLNISTYTVKSHIHNILEKMAMHSRLEIAIHSHENR